MSNGLPWFFVVGAQKSGTTTLHDWLSKSKEVALPWSKETHFFRDENLFLKGEEWYARQFRTLNCQTRVIGEVDPEYMYFPECAERLKGFTKAPKLIFVLREPLLRAYSNYLMSVRRGYESLSFADALCVEEDRMRSGDRFAQIHHGYIARGLYTGQVKRLLKVFPESRVMFVLFDDLFSTQKTATKVLRDICEFIGINHEKVSADVGVQKNQAAEARFTFVRDFVYGQGKIKKSLGKFIPTEEMKVRIMRFLDRMNMKPIPCAGAGSTKKYETPSFVYRIFINDLYKLEKLIHIDLSKWIGEYEKKLTKK